MSSNAITHINLLESSFQRAERLIACVDSLIAAVVLGVIAIPFGQVLSLPAGVANITGFELGYAAITFLLALKLVLTGKIRNQIAPVFILASFALYIGASAVIGRVGLGDVFRQVRYYWPFLISTLLLVTGMKNDARKFITYTAACGLVSASSALLLHYVFSSFVASVFAKSPETAYIIQSGRMYWANDMVVFFVILHYFAHTHASVKARIWSILALIVAVAAAFNTLNRTIALGMLVYVLGLLFATKGWREGIRQSIRLLLVAGLCALLLAILIGSNAQLHDLVYSRYLGGGGGAQEVYAESVEFGRMILYVQYWDSIKQHFPWGQGFGHPFAYILGEPSPVTDVSILSFFLPFGVVGIFIFGIFIRCLWKMLTRASVGRHATNLKLLVGVSLLMSLNLDVYSRNNFVLLLTLSVLAYSDRQRPTISASTRDIN